MEFVCNANFKGDMKRHINLKKLRDKVPNSVLHMKPRQLVIKDLLRGSIIIFSSGKFRVMGCIDELDATFFVYEYTTKINDDELPTIQLQSYTAKCDIGFAVNLTKLATSSSSLDYIYMNQNCFLHYEYVALSLYVLMCLLQVKLWCVALGNLNSCIVYVIKYV